MLRLNPDNAEAWVRALYFLHNLVLEVMGVQAVVGVDYYEACGRLLDYFRQGNTKFSDNAEYLFFMGVIGHIAEYYWGEEDDTFAQNMSKKAFELEPANRLYEWSSLDVRRNKSECERKVFLSQAMLANSPEETWLQTKGFPGRYVLAQIEKYFSRFVCTDNGAISPVDKLPRKYRE